MTDHKIILAALFHVVVLSIELEAASAVVATAHHLQRAVADVTAWGLEFKPHAFCIHTKAEAALALIASRQCELAVVQQVHLDVLSVQEFHRHCFWQDNLSESFSPVVEYLALTIEYDGTAGDCSILALRIFSRFSNGQLAVSGADFKFSFIHISFSYIN